MVTNIPIELFGLFMALAAVMIGIGIATRVGIIVMVGGLFVLFMAVLPDNIIMGSQVATSTISGSSTTYTYNTVVFAFTSWAKVGTAFLGAMIMLVGFMVGRLQP